MDLTREVLVERYSKFSDAALLAAKTAGPGPYSPLAWEVIQSLIAARGLTDRASAAPAGRARPAAPAPAPRAEPVESVEPSPERAVSPYFFVSRLRRERWPADAELPLTAGYVLGVAALIFGLAGVVLIILAFVRRGPAESFNLAVLEQGIASAASLAFAYSARRPPSPRHWWFALLYSGVVPPLALKQMKTATSAPGPLIALEVVVGLLWLLYFARRRAAYGLRQWSWLG